jgi:ATP-dependent DNA helicase RecQ
VAIQHLAALTHWAESAGCRRVPLLAYFGENFTSGNCGMCDNCLAAKSTKEVDITIPAHKFLSCVKRTGEIFGAAHIADVLLGSQNVKVLKFNHQQLTTFGIGKELTKKQWIDLSRQLVQKGFLLQDDHFGGLKLTPQDYAAFKSKDPILGVIQREIPVSHAKGKPSQDRYDHDLFEILRQKRKELADTTGVPPYVIFSDRTLAEMASYYPQSQEALLKINGVGEVKLKRYGKVFMDLIVGFCRDHDLESKDKPAVSAEQRRKAGTGGSGKTSMVGEAYNAGVTVPELMSRFQVKQVTILNHLMRYLQEGNKLRRSEELLELSHLSSDLQAEVMVAFAEQGDGYLRQIYDRFNGAVSYEELSILRLFFLANRE